MKRNFIFWIGLLLALFHFRAESFAQQCIVDAGSLVNNPVSTCAFSQLTIPIEYNNDGVIDSNNILIFTVHTGPLPQPGTILAWNTNPFIVLTLPPGTYNITAIAGSPNPNGFIDFNNPCIDYSNSIQLTVLQSLSVIATPDGVLSCANPDVTIQTSITPPGNYFFFWTNQNQSQVSNDEDPTFTEPGLYFLEVFDSLNGCWGSAVVDITSSDTTLVIISPTTDICAGFSLPVTLEATLTSGVTNLQYSWSNGASGSSIIANVFGDYCVTITDLNDGCVRKGCLSLTPSNQPLSVAINYIEPWNCIDSISGLYLTIANGGLAFSTLWSNGSTNGWLPQPAPGQYTVTVTSINGCTATAGYFVEDNLQECGSVSGKVFADQDNSCLFSTADVGLKGFSVRFESTTNATEYYGWTDDQGNYAIDLPTDTYTATVVAAGNLWQQCQPTYTVVVDALQPAVQDFPLQASESCAQLNTDIATGLLRRCFDSYYFVTYNNSGTADAINAYIDVTLDDKLTYKSSTLPGVLLSGNTYRFQLDTVAFNSGGQFTITVQVSCNAVLGEVHCTTAEIFPHDPCPSPNPQWSGASVSLSATCNADSLRFTVKNSGSSAMTIPLEYVVVEDIIMMRPTPQQMPGLVAGEEITIAVPANGATWRLEVLQEPLHPGNSAPSLTIEGCSTDSTFSLGMVNLFPLNDADPWIDEDCTPNQGSYDPNDKQAFPVGFGAEHYIKRDVDLEYMIRFQNTGTDTAFTVVIRDTLSPFLDPGTLVPGPSSHSYTFDYRSENVIKFTFDNILLPDSNTNLAGSQGFVTFRISQRDVLPLHSEIFNQAAIYFDFNEPVLTNTTFHRIGEDFVPSVSTWNPRVPNAKLRIIPNPMSEQAFIEFESTVDAPWDISILSPDGRFMKSGSSAGPRWMLQRGELPTGLYFVQIHQNGVLCGTAKLLVD